MRSTHELLIALFENIEQYQAALWQQIGWERTQQHLHLVQELVVRLPHKYLLAATKEEIQAAGRNMLAEGRSKDEMKSLQSTLVGLLDHVYRTGVLHWHPLRGLGARQSGEGAVPEVALVVGLPDSWVDSVRSLLEPIGVAVHGEPAHPDALEKVSWFPYAFILCAFPMLSPAEFLGAIRGARSLCRSAGVALLAVDEHLEAADRLIGRGANRIVDMSSVEEQLPQVISELGMVSERTKVRFTVHADLEDGKRSEVWQSENVSASGLLVRTSTALERGTEIDLDFKVPGDDLPIHVRAEVVRSTTFGREDFSGLGCRFLSFVGEGQHRLELFLRRA